MMSEHVYEYPVVLLEEAFKKVGACIMFLEN